MKLTRASDYALRFLTHLASNDEEVTSNEIAKRLDIPYNHMAKLVQILARRGYLATKKGKGGGFKLAIDPRKINIGEIIEAIEGPLVVSECIFHKNSCRFSSKCKVRKTLAKVRNKINSILSCATIYDLAITK